MMRMGNNWQIPIRTIFDPCWYTRQRLYDPIQGPYLYSVVVVVVVVVVVP